MASTWALVLLTVDRFLSWWGGELRALVPWSSKPGLRGRRLVLTSDHAGARLFIESGHRRTAVTGPGTAEIRAREVDDYLAAYRSRGGGLPIVVRLPYTSGLVRWLQLPAAATPADIGRMASLDLERAAPFRREEVLVIHERMPGPAIDGRVRVRQIVLKRETVRAASRQLERHGLAADRIECWDEDGKAPIMQDFLTWDRAPASSLRSVWPGRLVLTASVLGVAVVAVAIGRIEQAEAVAISAVEQRRKFSAEATAQRDASGRTGRLTATLIAWSNAHPSRGVIIETLSRLLPDTDYLTGLQVDGKDIELSGYSASTAALVPLIERSGVFADATLTSPAVFEPRTGKERFTLRARITSGVPGTIVGKQGG